MRGGVNILGHVPLNGEYHSDSNPSPVSATQTLANLVKWAVLYEDTPPAEGEELGDESSTLKRPLQHDVAIEVCRHVVTRRNEFNERVPDHLVPMFSQGYIIFSPLIYNSYRSMCTI